MHTPRITVITPSYNQGKYLERAICSVLDQDYANLEYFIVDGGSWDESPRVIELYDEALTGFIHEHDRGAAEAINKALLHATGDIIMVLHADDLLLPDALRQVARCMSQNNWPLWGAGHAIRINEHDHMLGEQQAAAPCSVARFVMHDSGYLPASATFWRRKAFRMYGYFDEQFPRAYAYEFACRLLTAGHMPHILGSTLAARREHDASRGVTQAVELGMETLQASQRFASHLTREQRQLLADNCEKRRRILALAQAQRQAAMRKAA